MRIALITNLSFLRTQVEWMYRITGNDRLLTSLSDLEEGFCLTKDEQSFLNKLNATPISSS